MSEPAPTVQRLTAELLGTFVLVLTGCGTAVLAATFLSGQIQLGVGFLGVSLAFGLSVLTMAYAVGHVSGGHFNPAVTLGLAASGRFPWKDVATYVAAQVAGAVVAATVLFAVASGREGFSAAESGFATNGFGERSPGGYSLMAGLVVELVLTGVFLLVILGVTDTRAPKGFAPMAIGLALTLIHLVSIPVTNTSVNPARSIGPALFVGWDAIAQLWLFLLAPAAGALLVGFAYRALLGDRSPAPLEEAAEG